MEQNILSSNFINKTKYFLNKQNFDISISGTGEKLNILYFNSQSMRNKLHEIIFFINSFKYPIHLIIVSETYLYEEENVFYDICGFKAYHSNRIKNKKRSKSEGKKIHDGRGGGVSVYVNVKLCSTFVSSEYTDNKNF